MKNSNKSIWFKGGGILLSIALLTGCGKKPEPDRAHNDNISTRNLYVANFKDLTNQSGIRGFNLNNYSPVGYNTRTRILKFDGITWNKKYESNPEIYELVECSESTTTVVATNIIAAPLTLGLNLMLGGGSCTKRSIFEHERFDKEAKEWVETNGIDRKSILTQYEILHTSKQKITSEINDLINEKNSQFNPLYESYQKKYSAQNPKILKKHKDASGFYKKENLSQNISLSHNTLARPSSFAMKNYSALVDTAFPCNTTAQCIENMKNTQNKIVKTKEQDQESVSSDFIQAMANYEDGLKKQTAYINITKPQGENKENFGKKALYYTIDKVPSEVPSTQKGVEALYTITRADFSDIYPAYANENKELNIVFNPETLELKLQNNTKQFIQLNSISLYYGDNIYQLLDNQSSNFARELSPESVSTNKIPNVASESSYTNMTKTKALAQKVNFGFAIKYTIGDSTKNNTLYKQKEHSVYDLLKNL